MSNDDDLDILTIEEDRTHDIEMGEALERLKKNPDFQKVITNGYLDQKVKASVSLLAVPQIKQQGHRPDIMEDLVSASNLQYFFLMVEEAYAGAKDPIYSDEELAEIEAANQSSSDEGGVH